VSKVAVVVASVDVPVTLSVPLEVRDDVAVIDPPVRVLMVEVIALSVVAKKLVLVAFVAVRFVKKPVVAFKSVAKRLVLVAFVVEALVAAKLLVAVALVTERDVSPEMEEV
jgi:hypothetical protein